MKYHVITIACLAGALLFYAAGLAGMEIAAFLCGVMCEMFFWGRLIGRLRLPRDRSASGT